MKRVSLGVVAAMLFALPVSAGTIFFTGTIGKSPVFASLDRDGNRVIGSYLYLRYAKQIELEGKIDGSSAFHLDETSFDTTKKSGSFDGHIANGVWSGTWTNATGDVRQPFSLTENHDTLANFTGDFRCTEKHRDKKYGYDYSRSAHVTFVKGTLTRLDLAQGSVGQDGDSQGCSIDLTNLKRVTDAAGIVLRAKGDVPGQKDMEHCTVHVVGNANFIYVAPGDLSEEHNDCKGAADVMFCSTRANFGEFLIDQSGVCKPND